ncbi:MAG: TIGR02302 family protein [Dongiaceae bacterium]
MAWRGPRAGPCRPLATEVKIARATKPSTESQARIRLPAAPIWLARLAVLWETLWPALWPALSVVGVFLIVALFDLLVLLPGWLHLAALVGFAVALAYGLGHVWPALRLPDRFQGIRRIEVTSGFRHRPLVGVDDTLATSVTDPEARALWQYHRRRLAEALGSLRIGRPRSRLIERDPYALRALIGLLVAVAVIGTWGEAGDHLRRALSPKLTVFAASEPANMTLSVTPPSYTSIAPIFLEASSVPAPATGSAEPPSELRVPQGSIILGQVRGGGDAPALVIGDSSTSFETVESGTYQVQAEIRDGTRLAVTQSGRTLGSWPMAVIADLPPTVAFAAPPSASERRALRLAFQATDDYGVASVTAIIKRTDGVTGPGTMRQVELNLPLPGLDHKQVRQASYHDLTPHPWAGLTVEIQLISRDAIGQTAASEPVTTIMPERAFSHPVARAIIEQRKRLIVNSGDRLPVSRALFAIAAQPPTYDDDIVVALGLRIAQRRLILDRESTAVDSVVALLWELALRIEEGELAVAERELRQVQQALLDALANNASDEEIERLMNELQQAMDKFIAALAQQLERESGRPRQRMVDRNAIELQRDDLQKMLERARELSRSGAREAARDLLAQLQEMLENLRMQPGDSEMDPMTAEALKMLEQMDDLSRRQQELLDQTFRRAQDMEPGQEGEGRAGAAEQEALRRALGEMMRRYGDMMGEIPTPLGRAERSMRDATGALRQGLPGKAIDPQTRALSELQQGMQEMASEMMKQLGRQGARHHGEGAIGQARDPLGRNQNGMGMIDTGDVQIPDQSDVQRAKQIIDELRRRSGERNRPKIERDYIDRLLKRF